MRDRARTPEQTLSDAASVPTIKWNIRGVWLVVAFLLAGLILGAIVLYGVLASRTERRSAQDDRDKAQNARIDTNERESAALRAELAQQDAEIRRLQRQLLDLINTQRKTKGLPPLPAVTTSPPSTNAQPGASSVPRPAPGRTTVILPTPRPGATTTTTSTATRTVAPPASPTPALRICVPLVGCPLG